MPVEQNVAADEALSLAMENLNDWFTIDAVLALPMVSIVALNVGADMLGVSVDQAYATLVTIILMVTFVVCQESADVSRTIVRRQTEHRL